jgi:acetylornithine deacetylase
LQKAEALYGVVGEPTDLKVVTRHKGVTRFHIYFVGKSAHSSEPKMGINAIENANEFISKLVVFRERIGIETDPELGSTILPVTFVQGGIRGRFNAIPELCELVIVCRRLPRHSSDEIRRGLQDIIDELKGQKGSRFDARIEIQYEANSLQTRNDLPIVQIGEKLTGSKSTFAPYGTEAAYYQDLGIPSVVLGPGSVEQAHIPDEFVEVKQLQKAVHIYSSMIEEICM